MIVNVFQKKVGFLFYNSIGKTCTHGEYIFLYKQRRFQSNAKRDMGEDKATGTPEESARGIMGIVEKKVKLAENLTFITAKGEQMPL
ncbi:hypothetical protein CJ195_24000 [Bacillus sp. UMB0899]|nr:hypothetical protein CJ195_24000 [Bacillus sp. UMB0899]